MVGLHHTVVRLAEDTVAGLATGPLKVSNACLFARLPHPVKLSPFPPWPAS